MGKLGLLLNYKVGIDLAYLPRFNNKVDNDGFINKVLTNNEKEIFNKLGNFEVKRNFLAGRFAVKEAYAKAKKIGIGKIDFLDIEILRDEHNAPIISNENADVSISHDKDYVIAIVIVGDRNE